jgi:dihydroflavonol-4-reductase
MIAVTGASGLLGSFVVRRLLDEGHTVIGIRRKEVETDLKHSNLIWKNADVQDPVALLENLKGVSAVIHAAASVSFNPRRRNEIFDINVTGTKNVVDACLMLGFPKMIHVSSVAALGRKKSDELIDESVQWVDGPLNSDYAKSKYLAELEVYRGIEEGLECSIVNPSFILAPFDWNRSSAKIFEYVWDERKFFPPGVANYVDVEDVTTIITKLLANNFNGERFIASAGSIPYQYFFAEIAKRFKKQPPTIEVKTSLLPFLARLEEFKSWALGKEPTISRESIKSARAKSIYSSNKAQEKLGIQFKSLTQTLDTYCDYFLRTYSTKKG